MTTRFDRRKFLQLLTAFPLALRGHGHALEGAVGCAEIVPLDDSSPPLGPAPVEWHLRDDFLYFEELYERTEALRAHSIEVRSLDLLIEPLRPGLVAVVSVPDGFESVVASKTALRLAREGGGSVVMVSVEAVPKDAAFSLIAAASASELTNPGLIELRDFPRLAQIAGEIIDLSNLFIKSLACGVPPARNAAISLAPPEGAPRLRTVVVDSLEALCVELWRCGYPKRPDIAICYLREVAMTLGVAVLALAPTRTTEKPTNSAAACACADIVAVAVPIRSGGSSENAACSMLEITRTPRWT